MCSCYELNPFRVEGKGFICLSEFHSDLFMLKPFRLMCWMRMFVHFHLSSCWFAALIRRCFGG